MSLPTTFDLLVILFLKCFVIFTNDNVLQLTILYRLYCFIATINQCCQILINTFQHTCITKKNNCYKSSAQKTNQNQFTQFSIKMHSLCICIYTNLCQKLGIFRKLFFIYFLFWIFLVKTCKLQMNDYKSLYLFYIESLPQE